MFEFNDQVENKYSYMGTFNNGLALVRNQKYLYGYINKKGEEVIPCKYKNAKEFSEGLACIQDNNGLWGFINKEGKIVIPFNYKNYSYFKDGVTSVQDKNNLYGYIDKLGNYIIEPKFIEASNFYEGYACVKYEPNKYCYINTKGEKKGSYRNVSPFYNGLALVCDENQNVHIIDKTFKKKYTLKENWNEIQLTNFDMYFIINNEGKYGFLDNRLNLKIPFMYKKANGFKNDVSIVEFDDNFIGFVTKEGKNIAFSKKYQYQVIGDFYEDLAPVKNINGLWGFINKDGKEVIKCKYKDVDDFYEGLACIIDQKDNCYYINKKGVKKLEIDKIYRSTLILSDKYIYIEAQTQEALNQKKLQVLNIAKKTIISNIEKESNDIEELIIDDLYQKIK